MEMKEKKKIMFYVVLFLVSVLLTLFYAVWSQSSNETYKGWSQIQPVEETVHAGSTCVQHNDCGPNHVCIHGKCVPTMNRGECNPLTGEWVLTKSNRARCVCRYPALVTQSIQDGDCNVGIGCGPGGKTIDFETFACECKPNYIAVKRPDMGETCVKIPPMDRPCGVGELENPSLKDGFSATFLASSGAKCPRTPCTFDVLTGAPVTGGHWRKDFGCVCDPRRGLVGAYVKDLEPYLIGGGNNVCMSVLENRFRLRGNVHLYNYFYLGDSDPVSFVEFRDIHDVEEVQPLFRPYVKNKNLIVEQKFGVDYFQYILKISQNYTRHARVATGIGFLFNWKHDEHVVKGPSYMMCSDIAKDAKKTLDYGDYYHLLYEYIACQVHKNETPAKYAGHYVLNPYLSLHPHDTLLRSNGLHLRSRQGNWYLDTDTFDGPLQEQMLLSVDRRYVPTVPSVSVPY